MQVLDTVVATKQVLRPLRQKGMRVGFVPTMGALHAGHIALAKQSLAQTDRTVVSIFVNPAQFGPNEDLGRYPRTLEADIALLQAAGCHYLFVPSAAEIYHAGEDLRVQLPSLATVWEGASRPGHFDGVALVVAKLMNIVLPDAAFFGQKDFQQTVVLRRLARDLFWDTEIVVCPTLREADGLALSSRNRYLTTEQRAAAPFIYQTLLQVKHAATRGADAALLTNMARAAFDKNPHFKLDYFEIISAHTLHTVASVQAAEQPVAIVAAYLGSTRLIDNLPLLS